MAHLRLEGVGKSFGGLRAVADVALAVPPGEIVGLIGPNGAGKTTIVNMITGLLSVTAGTIKFGEEDLTHASMGHIARAGISRTFQNIRLLPQETVLDNVVSGYHRLETASWLDSLLGLPRAHRETRELRARASELLKRFGMERYAGHTADGLSYGHQRRVEMMRAIASSPALLLLDEPVAGMNDVEATDLGKVFSGLANAGLGLLLIEHNMRFVMSVCTTVNVLNAGRLIASGPPAEVMRNPDVITAYLGA
jgi:branched-chain amino acid transport system ATP-binding protein